MAYREPRALTNSEIEKIKSIIEDYKISDHIDFQIEEGSIELSFDQCIFAVRAFNTPEGENKYRMAECTVEPKTPLPAYEYDDFKSICLQCKIWCREIRDKFST
ncbi:MAG TPA: hypothetical protein PK263_05955 [bacterium]|nr:hypothetical protein [bacterium]